MNLSVVSTYENENSGDGDNLSKSTIYRTINDLLCINGAVEFIIFCPLCVHTFEYKFSLFEHLRTFHHGFLMKASDKNLCFRECPFCSAKFYGKHLTVKHTLLHHSKIIKELFVDSKSKCFFCLEKLNKNDCSTAVKHIEEMHFMDFEGEFNKKFSDSVTEMTFSDLINSTNGNDKSQSGSACWEDVCVNFKNNHSTKVPILNSTQGEAGKTKCFDFADIKQQLQNLSEPQEINKSEYELRQRSILKDNKIAKQITSGKSVRRVLRFDIPNNEGENKENRIFFKNFAFLKQATVKESSLLSDEKKFGFLVNDITENWSGQPKHSSTPNTSQKFSSKNSMKKKTKNKEIDSGHSNFTSYINLKTSKYEFQCGKCSKLFKENLELVSHVKSNHNKFSLKILKPCYSCGICSARFYKNNYLRKHHRLHSPY